MCHTLGSRLLACQMCPRKPALHCTKMLCPCVSFVFLGQALPGRYNGVQGFEASQFQQRIGYMSLKKKILSESMMLQRPRPSPTSLWFMIRG